MKRPCLKKTTNMPKSVQLKSRSSLPLQILQFCNADLHSCLWVAVFSVTSAKLCRIITVNIFILIIDVGLMPSLASSQSLSASLGCRDGAVVRALVSHQCGPGSLPRSGVKCGLSLLLLYSALRGFLWVLRFPLSSKTSI